MHAWPPCHAGTTSTTVALSFGVPIAAMPQIPEECLNADRLAEPRLGLCLEPAQQAREGVLAAVTTLMHDLSIRPRLAWMRAGIDRAPGAAGAADVIENALADGDDDRPVGQLDQISE